jgi:hypothetical protein
VSTLIGTHSLLHTFQSKILFVASMTSIIPPPINELYSTFINELYSTFIYLQTLTMVAETCVLETVCSCQWGPSVSGNL